MTDLIFHGWHKTTLLDYPDKIATLLFTSGCNYRCPFCHNSGLVTSINTQSIPSEVVLSYLSKRVGKLDGVCVSGGEPLLQSSLIPFLEEVKKMGFCVKLDTNGSLPSKLKEVIERKLVDYIAMDIKNSPALYSFTVGIEAVDLDSIRQSIAIIRESGVPYEFRTTLVKEFHKDIGCIHGMGGLIYGSDKWVLQKYRDSDTVISKIPLHSLTDEEMDSYLNLAEWYVKKAVKR